MPPIVECERVSKSFVIRENRQYLLKDRALAMLRPHLREHRQAFWALQDVDFTVERGEAFAVIGPNGSGKTTLFRLISGIFLPTSGAVHVHGRLAPLLAIGVGFQPELTGRENIYLSSAMLGFTTREIRAAEEDIIAFSELARFIDVPTKNYSAGMQARLGFAIAFQVRPEIFLIDEVLSVGDEQFQEKCLRRLDADRHAGRTFLVATHALPFVEERCDRAALLMEGRIVAIGASKEVVRQYRELFGRESRPFASRVDA